MRAPYYSSCDDELLDQEAISNPHKLYERLRVDAPLSRVGETGVHLVCSWGLIEEVLDREIDFSANLSGVLYRGEGDAPQSFELPQSAGTQVIATADDPRHDIHRKILQPYFTPSRIAPLEPKIRGWVREEMALVSDSETLDALPLCERVPARVVAQLLGLPQEDVDYFRTWAMMGGDMLAGEVSSNQLHFLATETTRMAEYLGQHLDLALAEEPRAGSEAANILQVLAQAVQAESIDREEALGIAIVLFGAGGESTSALIASCLKGLAEDPAQAALLKDNLELIPRYVEEITRLETPFKFHYRSVTRPCTLAGYSLDKGDRLMLVWAAANRDPSHVEDACALKLDRKHPKQHMGFGRGIHFCIGAVLARLEARVVVEELLAASDHLSMAGDACYVNSIFVRRLGSLHVRRTLAN